MTLSNVNFENGNNGNNNTLKMFVEGTYAGQADFYLSEEKRNGEEVKLWVVNVDVEDNFKDSDYESMLFDQMEAQIVDLSDETISRSMNCAIVDEDDDASVYYRNGFDDVTFSIHDDPGFLVVGKAF